MVATTIATLVANFEANNQNLVNVARQNEQIFHRQGQLVSSLNGIFGQFNREIDSLTSAFISFASVAGVIGLGIVAKNAAEAATEFVEFGRQVGLTTEQVQLLDRVFQGDGATVDNVRSSLNDLSRILGNTGTASEEATKAFEALGLNLEDLQNGNVSLYDTLLLISDGLKEVENQTERVAIANTLLGGEGRRLLLPLEQGARSFEEQIEHMRRLGVITDEHGSRLKDLAQSFSDFDTTLSATTQILLASLQPALQSLLETLTEIVTVVRDVSIQTIEFIDTHHLEITVRLFGALSAVLALNLIRFRSFNKILGESGFALRTIGSALRAVGATILALTKGLISAARVFFIVEALIFLSNVIENVTTRLQQLGISLHTFLIDATLILTAELLAGLVAIPETINNLLTVAGHAIVDSFSALGEAAYNALTSAFSGESASDAFVNTLAQRFDEFREKAAQILGNQPLFQGVRDRLLEQFNISQEEFDQVKDVLSGSIIDVVRDYAVLFTGAQDRINETLGETNEALREIPQNLDEVTVNVEGLSDATQEAQKTVEGLGDTLQSVAERVNSNIGRSFGEFAGRLVTDITNIREQLHLLVNDIQRAVIRQAIVEPISAGITGALGSLSSSLFASPTTTASSFSGTGPIRGTSSYPILGSVHPLGPNFQGSFQHGGYAGRGFAIVGEGGPELVHFNRGGQVYPAPVLTEVLSGSGGGQNVTVNFNQTFNGTNDASDVRRMFFAELPNIEQKIKQSIMTDMRRNSQIRESFQRGR